MVGNHGPVEDVERDLYHEVHELGVRVDRLCQVLIAALSALHDAAENAGADEETMNGITQLRNAVPER